MNGTWWTVVVAVLVAGVVVRRFTGEPLDARDLFVPPVVLIGIGVHTLVKDTHPGARDVAWIVVAAAVGLILGALRGLTPRLFTRRGHLWQRYTPWTLLVWVVSMAANLGTGALAVAAGASEQARPITLSIGVGLLGEALTLGLRALAAGVPFSPGTASLPDRLRRSAARPSGTAGAAPGTAGAGPGPASARPGVPRTPGRGTALDAASRVVARWAGDGRA
ncbi:hypothetical protein ACLQ2R_26200 [Streptosporangium sp. DT93]|uniref:hypothetical protein n=1 Tax=Streptosporangium sp. DT93 TaxID=3393428 RepID=UPI003CEFD838